MIKEYRQRLILDFLNRESKISIKKLSQEFNVSDMTIRRDIKEFEKKQIVELRNGVVFSKTFQPNLIPIEYRKTSQIIEKKRIGKKAATLIEDSDTIIIDSGTTTLELSINLLDKNNLTVITNDFNVANTLKKNHNIEIIFLGGKIHYPLDYLVTGCCCSKFLRDFGANKLFFSVQSIDLNKGIFTSDLDIANVKKTMMDVAEETILLADHSKFNSWSKYRVSSFSDVDLLITDKYLEYHDKKPSVIMV